MKKKFKDTAFAKIAGSILKGAITDTLSPVIGVASGAVIGLKEGINKVKQENLAGELGGQGNPDWVRLGSLVLFVGLIALMITGKITFEQVDKIFSLFTDNIQ